LWKYSRWQTQKQICARYGAVKGDVAIKVVDDEVNGKVRLAVVNPDTLRWVQLDPEGHVLAYELWEPRFDPRYDPRKEAPGQPGANEQTVIYGEKVRLDPVSKIVTFSTYLNGQPYGWYGNPPEWDRKYGFVPLVLHPHIQMHPGYFWGASEYTTAFRKACELDDVSSKQHDHIRKASAPKWFLSGVTAPKKPLSMGGNDPSATDTMPGRQQEEFFYAGVGAGATPMVFPVDNQFVSLEVQNQLMALEKDYPELRYDSARAAGDASAKALREVRKSAEAKVHDRRSGYDEALERVQKMALAIGGINGYPGFESFKDGQYFGEELDHEIGERSVFLMDPLDRIEEEQALATCWQTFKLAGWPDEVLMERFDFSPEEMLSFTAAAEAEKQKALDQQVALAQAKPAPTAPPAKAS
jgi:hypothetical protein